MTGPNLYCRCPDTCKECGAEYPSEFCSIHGAAFELLNALRMAIKFVPMGHHEMAAMKRALERAAGAL